MKTFILFFGIKPASPTKYIKDTNYTFLAYLSEKFQINDDLSETSDGKVVPGESKGNRREPSVYVCFNLLSILNKTIKNVGKQILFE